MLKTTAIILLLIAGALLLVSGCSADTPDGANLNESEVLQKALEVLDPATEVTAVKSICFDDETGIWTIELQDVFRGEGQIVEVKD